MRAVLPAALLWLVFGCTSQPSPPRAPEVPGPIAVLASAPHIARLERLSPASATLTPDAAETADDVTMEFRILTDARINRYILDVDGSRVDQLGVEEPLMAGIHQAVWRGVIRGRPAPPGLYRYVVESRDGAGQRSSIDTEILVPPYVFPVGRIMRLEIASPSLRVGEPLNLRVRVRNTGPVPLRTSGLDLGSFAGLFEGVPSLAGPESVRGTWRVAAGLADGDRGGGRDFWRPGGSATSPTLPLAQRYPFRWGLGRTLAPGEEIDVSGQIELPGRQGRWWVYTGLIHEGFVVHDDGVSARPVEVRP